MVHESVAVVLASVEPPDIWQTSAPFDTGVPLRRPLPRHRFPQEILPALIKVLIRPSWSLNHSKPLRRPAILWGKPGIGVGPIRISMSWRDPLVGCVSSKDGDIWVTYEKSSKENLWRYKLFVKVGGVGSNWFRSASLKLDFIHVWKKNASNHGVILFPKT